MLCPVPSTLLGEQVAVLQEGDIILPPGPGWGPEKGQASWPLGASSHGAGGRERTELDQSNVPPPLPTDALLRCHRLQGLVLGAGGEHGP